MDFRLTDEQSMIRQTVRQFVERELFPLESEALLADRRGEDFPDAATTKQLQAKARDIGFWGINTPKEYGGADLGQVTQAIVAMELGRTFIPFTFGGSADNILYHANDEQKQEYLIPTIQGERLSCFALTEPGAGSDAARIQMRAVPDGDDWILTGTKIFITNGNHADFAMVFAVTDPNKTGRGRITCFLVDRAMGWTSQFVPTMGSWGPAILTFDNVRVPARNILGPVGEGFRIALEWIGFHRWMIGARAVGAAERLLQMAVDHARMRETFGEPLANRQAIQWMIADSAVEIEATRWLSLVAAWKLDQGLDNRHEASMAKLYGANMANQVVDRVLQIHGGMGYTKDLPIERWYRDMRVWRIYDGTDEMQRLVVSRNLLKGYRRIGDWPAE